MSSDSSDHDDEVVLVTKEAARLLKQHEQTLFRWRTQGYGPKFIRLGRKVVYRKSTLLAWLADEEERQGGGHE